MTDILYYDGQCPLCVKEMDRLRDLKSDSLELRDIHTLGDASDPAPSGTGTGTGTGTVSGANAEDLTSSDGSVGTSTENPVGASTPDCQSGVPTEAVSERPDKDTLLRVLHLERDGEMLTGIDANVAAWQHTRYGYLWRWLRWPIIRPIVELFYDRWARWRYDRLYR